MNRTGRISLAVTAVSAVAVLPLGALAAHGSGPAACILPQAAVPAAQNTVSHAQAALRAAERKKARSARAKAKRQQAVAKATRRLAKDEAKLTEAQAALLACEDAQPTPTITATATVTATTTYTAPALSWISGTALLKETMPDGSAIAPLGYWDGVPIAGTGFGSAWTEDPNHPGYFYGLTDRGPNVTAPDGTSKLEPLDGFQDSIGYFHAVGGTLQLVKTIGLTLPSGEPLGGLENTEADAGEKILDQYGDTMPHSATGLDTEGLVAMPDGTFWVSDEYGPFIVHVDATGKELTRFDPYVTSAGTSPVFGDAVTPLPGELKRRKPNKGMEGLTPTPDGKYLVGIMQSPLDKNFGTGTASSAAVAAGKGAITRIVKVSLSDPSDVHEYLYSLHTKGAAANPAGQAVSEITALPGDDDHFVVDERDGNMEGTKDGTASGAANADKNLWEIDLTHATDVGPKSALIGTSIAGGTVAYDATSGLNVGGKSVEDLAGTLSDAGAISALSAAGISTGAESLYLDYAALVTAIDPTGMYFGHDKVEGVSLDTSNPNIVYLSNDSDFGITDLPAGADPTADKRAKGADAEKFLPDGKTQDFGEVLEVDLGKIPAQFT